MPSKKFLTVVFQVDDPTQSAAFTNPIFAAFAGDKLIPGLTVTGMSIEDEMSKVERLEALLDGEGIDHE